MQKGTYIIATRRHKFVSTVHRPLSVYRYSYTSTRGKVESLSPSRFFAFYERGKERSEDLRLVSYNLAAPVNVVWRNITIFYQTIDQ